MALIPRFAFLVLLLLPYQCEAKTEKCSVTQCLLLPDEDDPVALEFNFQASEKGVRLVYINLVIGNASYDPLELPDVFLPHRWVWANTIHEPMLSLPDDYDILSVGLLNYQVRSIDVKLKDHPSGCLAKLGSTCQNQAVGRMLLENVTSSGISGGKLHKKTPVVCVALINRSVYVENVKYHCCYSNKEATEPATIRCDQIVDDNAWSTVVFAFSGLISLFLAFYVPALPRFLPDYIFSLEEEVEKENRLAEQTNRETTGYERIVNPPTAGEQDNQMRTPADQWSTGNVTSHTSSGSTSTHDDNTNREETGQNTLNCEANGGERGEESEFIPIDDSSPMILSTLLRESVQKFPDMPFSFNIKLAVMCLCVYPCVLYVQIGLYRTRKKTSVDEIVKKRVLVRNVFSRQTQLLDETVYYDFLALLFLVMTLLTIVPIIIMILFSRPKHFFFEENELCELCRFISTRRWRRANVSLTSRRSLGNEIRHHLKILEHYLWYFMRQYCSTLVSIYDNPLLRRQREEVHQESVVKHVSCVCLGLISFIVTLVILVVGGVLCLLIIIILLIILVVVFSPIISVNMFSLSKIVNRRGRNAGSNTVVWDLLVPLISTAVFINFSFFLSVTSCLFVSTVVAYIIIGLALNVSIVTPIVTFLVALIINVYSCYTKMQGKYREVKKMISERLQELQVNSNVPKDTIRAEIYWFVCDKVLPIKCEICRMLRNMVLVIAYLFLALYSIVFYGHEYDISTWIKMFSLFFTGSIPLLLLKELTKNSNTIGLAKNKMRQEIDKAVTEYRNSRNL